MTATKEDINWDMWRKTDINKYECDLGTMRKAVVVRYYRDDSTVVARKHLWWAISPTSWFPFSDDQREESFDSPYECMVYAQKIIMEWLGSIYADTPKLRLEIPSEKANNK